MTNPGIRGSLRGMGSLGKTIGGDQAQADFCFADGCVLWLREPRNEAGKRCTDI